MTREIVTRVEGPEAAGPIERRISLSVHTFDAVAFEENVPLKDLAALFPGARVRGYELHVPLPESGDLFLYSFGALVFLDVAAEQRERELARLGHLRPRLAATIVREEFTVHEDPTEGIGIAAGRFTVDRLTRERGGVIALTVAQSAAMEYYEQIIERLAARTSSIVDRLQTRGSVSMRTRPLHRFIGEAIGTRTEVLSVLHLLDKPDATWEDAAMDRIYDDLRAEFDLVDRYGALEAKVRSVQEALELLLDVARDRRLVLLEATIVVLIVFEIVLSLARVL
jgi:uncharacterized Rmd1/YagE family protein